VLINYPIKGLTYQTLSFVDIYNDQFDPSLVRNKIVIVGATATALHDEFFTPTGIMYGAVVHLNFISTILKQNFLTYVPVSVEYAVIAFLTLFFTLFLIHVESRSYQIGNSVITLFLGILFYFFVFLSSTILTHPVQLIIVIILSTS
jgi:CHASE2 domain-containing sensor protein